MRRSNWVTDNACGVLTGGFANRSTRENWQVGGKFRAKKFQRIRIWNIRLRRGVFRVEFG
jgi:hypothetical protein